jgi:hypothetical protein
MPLGWFGLREHHDSTDVNGAVKTEKISIGLKMERAILHCIGTMPVDHFTGATPGIFQSKGKSALG